MRNTQPYPIDKLFSNLIRMDYSSISKIKQHVIILLQLDRAVKMLLPASLRPWYRVINIREGIMVIETSSASWKLRLQYEQSHLLHSLKEQILPSLISIDIKINPNMAIKQTLYTKNNNALQKNLQMSEYKLKQLGTKGAASIRYVATQSEGKLRDALERLAKLAERNINPIDISKKSHLLDKLLVPHRKSPANH